MELQNVSFHLGGGGNAGALETVSDALPFAASPQKLASRSQTRTLPVRLSSCRPLFDAPQVAQVTEMGPRLGPLLT